MRRYLTTTFASLHHRNFRLYFAGQSVSVTGTWMQKLAQAWLVLELTDSGSMLGLTAALQALPTLLLTPWAGLIADRYDKRRILLCTQVAAAGPSLLLGVLSMTGAVTVWMVLALALATGLIEALDKPARLTFVTEIVGVEHLTNALTLNNIIQNVGKVAGPAAAGILIAAVGVSWSFVFNAVSFLAVVGALALMRADELTRGVPVVRARGQVREGLRYVRGEPHLLVPLALMTVTGLLAYNWIVILPLLARDAFDGSPAAVGLTFTSMGLGAVLGGLAVAGSLTATSVRLGALGVTFAVVMIAIALAPTFAVAVALLFLLGATSVSFRAVASSLLQIQAAPAMRGRVVSLLVVATGGTTPFGGPLIGWLSEVLGPRAALGLAGTSTAIASALALVWARRAVRGRAIQSEVGHDVSVGRRARNQAVTEAR